MSADAVVLDRVALAKHWRELAKISRGIAYAIEIGDDVIADKAMRRWREVWAGSPEGEVLQ